MSKKTQAAAPLALPWIAKINALARNTVESVLEIGKLFLAWKEEHRGEFEAQVAAAHQAGELRFGPRSAQHFMKIAQNPILADPNYSSALPGGWHTLYFLSQLEPARLEECLEEGVITPELSQADAFRLRRDHRNKTERELPRLEGSFSVVVADPPWRYEFVKTESRAIENQYPTLSPEEICELPDVHGIPIAPDAILYLWATNPLLPTCLRVLEAWGFEYRTNMVWVKAQMGMGFWARQQHELILIGVRGHWPAPDEKRRESSVIQARRTRHSAKPPDLQAYIERAYPMLEKNDRLDVLPKPQGWLDRLGERILMLPQEQLKEGDEGVRIALEQAKLAWNCNGHRASEYQDRQEGKDAFLVWQDRSQSFDAKINFRHLELYWIPKWIIEIGDFPTSCKMAEDYAEKHRLRPGWLLHPQKTPDLVVSLWKERTGVLSHWVNADRLKRWVASRQKHLAGFYGVCTTARGNEGYVTCFIPVPITTILWGVGGKILFNGIEQDDLWKTFQKFRRGPTEPWGGHVGGDV